MQSLNGEVAHNPRARLDELVRLNEQLKREVNERKKAEKAIRQSQEKFERLFMDNPEAAIYVGPDFRILDVNPRFKEFFGYSLEEIKGKHIDDIVVPTDKIKEAGMLDEKTGKGYVCHDTVRKKKDGSLVPVSISAAPITIEGQLMGYLALYKDITRRKKAEERLRESEEKYRNLFENARDVIITLDLKGNVTSVNKAVAEYGFKDDKFVGKNMRKYVSDRYWPRVFVDLVKVSKGSSVRSEIEIVTPKGKKILEYRSNPLRHGKKIVGIQSILRDVTERKRFEERLSALNNYSRNLNTADNTKKIYELTLDAMEKTLGFEHASFLIANKNMLCVVDQRGYPESLSLKLPLSGTKGGITVKAAKTRKSLLVPDTKKERIYVEGMPHIYSELAVPIKIGYKILGVLNVESKRLDAFDAKDQKLLEILASHAATAISNIKYAKNLKKLVHERTIELEKAQEQLLMSERLATIGEIAAMVGHDLRNPLQSIRNAVYYINNELPHPSIRQVIMEMLQVINDSVNYADKIIRDLHDFSTKRKPLLKKIDINDIVKETLSLVEAFENVELITELGHLPKIKADKSMIKRTFVNLALNGIQAMENGGTLKVLTKETRGFVEVSFQDTGIGIAKENMEIIYTPLFTTKARGMGIGLPICKKFVETHGGSIEVESEEGKGSTFTVKLPIK